MSRLVKRMLAMVLVIFMLAGFLPNIILPARAESAVTNAGSLNVGVEGLGAESTAFVKTSTGTRAEPVVHWAAGNQTITGTLGDGETTRTYAGYTTLILTNNLTSEAVLSFQWEASTVGGTAEVSVTYMGIDGAEVKDTLAKKTSGQLTGSGDAKKEILLAPGATAVFKLQGAATTSNVAEKVYLKLYNVELYRDEEFTTTFVQVDPAQGSYTVDGNPITETTQITRGAKTAYELKAIPAEGYVFSGWYSETTNKRLSTRVNYSFKSTMNQAVYPLFVKQTEAIWGVEEAGFANLQEAFQCAENSETKVVVLLQNYTLTENISIPNGLTLLIPFNDEHTCYLEKPEPLQEEDADNDGNPDNVIGPWIAPTEFCVLTLASGVTVTVNGNLSVSAQHHGGGNLTAGAPYGPCGFIKTEKNSSIVVADGGKLFAWGYIVGSGSVEALSGAAVYENIQFTDFRGGSATSSFLPKDSQTEEEQAKRVVFPFNQYYVQNVEIAMTIHAGAKEVVYTTIFAAGDNNSIGMDFIGTDLSMFRLEDGASITKRYDGATDRLVIEVRGNISVNGLSVDLSQMGQAGIINTSIFNLPITNNITINVLNGTTEINQNVALQAGAVVNIAEGATLYIGYGEYGPWNLYVYDRDEWLSGKFVFADANVRPISWNYTNCTNVIRDNSSLLDAEININGTLEVEGYLYTTAGGANIHSSEGTGMLIMWCGNGESVETWQATQEGTDVTFVSIPLTPVQLKNSDGTYTSTANASLDGAVYLFDAVQGTWYDTAVVSFDGNGATSGAVEKITLSNLDIMDGCGEIQLPENAFVRPNYKFVGWNTQADGKGTMYQPGDLFAVTKNVTLYAAWECQHANTSRKNVKEPTCTEEGYTGDLVCECGLVIEYGEVIEKVEHAFTKNLRGSLKTPGNCTTEAVYAVKCDNCSAESEDLTIKGEKDASKHTGKPVYTNNGETHSAAYDCCDAAYVTNEPHTYDQEGGKCICGAEKPHVCAENLTAHEAITPDCQTVGNTAYWSCTCGKFYSDAEATTPIEENSWNLGKGDHAFTQNLRGTLKTPGDCKTEAVYAVKCDKCDAESATLTVKGEKDASKHTGKAVYTNNGETHYAVYDCCSAVYVTNEPHTYDQEGGKCICGAEKPHVCAENLTEHKAVTPDCQTVGNTAYWSCTCGKFYADANATQEIAKDSWILGKGNHAFTQNLRGSVKTPGNCTTETVYAVKCDKCDVESEDRTIKGEKDASKHSGTPVYTNNGDTHSAAYNCCGAAYVTNEAHKYEDATYKCVCGAVYSGIYTDANGDKFFVVEGEAVANKGLVRVYENGEAKYYYFGCAATANDSHEDNSCDAYKAQKNCTHWVENTNGLLPAWDYTFGADGAIVCDDELNNNEQQSHKIVTYGDVKYYTIDGIKAPMGLVKVEGAYYYVRSNGALVCGQTYWVSKTNDLLPEGSYTFDAEGKMVDAPELPEIDENTNGIVGGYYYESGELTYAGLIEIEGKYYYVRSNGKLATGAYWVTKTNGLMPEASYNFDENGVMLNPNLLPEVDENTTGVVDGYYFENGVITYAGLIKLDGAYYYVRSNGQVAVGSYWISKTNGLLPEGCYTFAEDGKMVDAPEVPEVEEGFTGIKDGYYYENGVITYAGLIQLDGKYYYVRTSGKLATGKYWITKTNGLLPEGSYNFGADGAMIVE